MAARRSMLELCRQVGAATREIGREVVRSLHFLLRILCMFCDALRHPSRIKYSSVAYYMDSCGSDATPIIAMLGLLIGVILSFQAIIQLGRFGVESYVVNLVGSVIVTELAPLVTAVVLAGRSGSAFAAELGTMKTNEEIDALITLGLDPERFLVFPKVLALLLVLPGLTIIADVCGIFGGMLIVTGNLNISVAEYCNRVMEVVHPLDLTQGLLKSVFFGMIVAAVGCEKGIHSGRDAQGVGRSATSAVVTAIFLIVVADAILTACFAGVEKWS